MKILESKFYRPRLTWQHSNSENFKIGVKKDLDNYLASSTPFEDLLDNLLPAINLVGDNLVIKKEQLKDFEKCTDFHTVDYAVEHNLFYQEEQCYFHPKYEVFILAKENLSSEYQRNLHQNNVLAISYVYYDSTNEQVFQNIKHFFNEYLQKYVGKDAKVSILFKSEHGFYIKPQTIKPYHINLDTMYNEDFLSVHEHIKDKLTNDSKGLVMLHGIPGSGKTNYIKWLTSQIASKQFIFVPTNMIDSLTHPEFMSLLVDNKNSILVLEDCEKYIGERINDFGSTDVVSAILNIADGMLSDILECQFICTFNSDLSKIDSALLRHGRLIAEYKFKELSIERCNAYLQSLEKDIIVDRTYSLAELTNLDDKLFKEKIIEKRIGFV